MEFVKKFSLLAILLSAVFNFNALAQDAVAERFEAKLFTGSEKPKDDEVQVIVSKTANVFSDIADSNSYTFATTTTGSLTDMSTGTTTLLNANIDDTASPLTNIGFDFYYMGARFTQFSINENGVLRLGATAQTSTPYKPLAQAGVPIITAYGADQRTHAGDGKVHYKVIGSAPNRTLVVEWLNNQSNFNTGGTADLTYQVRLNESTGVIEFVYGSMTMSTLGAADTNSRDPHIGYSSSNLANTVGSVTAPQAGSPTFNGTSNDPTENLYTAGAITVLTSAVDGARRTMSFTPPTPTAPTGLSFTGVSAISITVNWTDSPNEDLYGIYRSTDGINYTFLATAAENATSFVDSTVFPGTTYFYRVFAISEGALSAALAGSQATSPAGSDTCAVANGNWNTPATWTDNSVPTAADNVTIGPGCTVTIDSSNAFSVTVQSGGVLQFEATTARTLTVTTDVTIDAGGTFQSNPAGTQTGHVLSVGGSLTNNGTLDFSTNGNTAAAGITFTGTGNTSFTLGAASTTDLKQTSGVTLNKGTNNTPILSFNPGGTLTVLGANTAGFLTITNGTFKMDGTGAFSNPLFSVAAYSIPSTGGLWMNNPNATVAGQNGSPTVTGLFRMTLGTFNIGIATGNSMGFAAGANILIEGGAVNATGRFGVAASANAITYNQSGGTITTCTIGNASTTLACFDLGTGVGTTNITGGLIVIQNASTAASGPRDYRNQSGLTGTTTVTGGTVQFGNASTGAGVQAFDVAGVFPNVVVDNTTAGHTVTFLAPAVFNNITRNVLVNPGTTFNVGNNVFLFNGTTFTNNGTLTGNGASTNFVIFLTGATVTYTGTGTVTVPLTNLAVQADGGNFTIDPATSGINANAVRLFSGNIINANKLTIGSGGATTAVVQIGNTTTPTNAGTFDTTPTFNPGTGGITFSYLRTSANRIIGPEIPASRSITTVTFDDNAAGRTFTLAGGNLTVTGTMTLTNGIVVTSAANTLIHNGATATRTGTCATTTCFVDGPLRREYPAATGTTYTFHVGEGVYSPVALANIVVAPPAELTVEAFNATLAPFMPATSISRNWGLTKTGAGTLTADVSFTYDQTDDVNGNEADYRLFRRDSGAPVEVCGTGCVDETTNVATITGLSSFSRWTIAEAFVPTAASVNIGGRVLTADGLTGLPKARVTISGNTLQQPITVTTSPFGYYSFADLPVGTYVLTVDAKQYTFNVPTRVVTAEDNITGVDFIANQ
jgi:Carboxypeptidase regulatory-like domain/G8 domain